MKNDARLLLGTRFIRLFAYGFLSVVLVLYLKEIGLSLSQIGFLLTATLAGDAVISLFLTTQADRYGRRRVLIVGAFLMLFAGILFSVTYNFFLLLFAAIVGVISPTGNEVGPFLSVEQAALSQIIANEKRTSVFAWYNLAGAVAIALGSLSSGFLSQFLQNIGFSSVESYRALIMCYALMGVGLGVLFKQLSSAVEVNKPLQGGLNLTTGLQRSKSTVLSLSALFALDAFGGGFVMQSIVAYWFYARFQVDLVVLGSIFFGANLLAGLSSLLAALLAKRIGLINTMVFTHIPSNLLLILIPFMPTLGLAITFLFLRFSISQMDVPTRQSYLMAVVEPSERSSAAGIAGVARTIGAALAPICAGPLLASSALMGFPFIIAGSLKIAYDIVLYRKFRFLKPPEEVKKEL